MLIWNGLCIILLPITFINQTAGNRIKTAIRSMKKILITMAVLTGMVAGAMVFSSFAAPRQVEKEKCTQIEASTPVYWEGVAYYANLSYGGSRTNTSIYITVYRDVFNSFYAKTKDGKEMVVKTNQAYDPDRRSTDPWYKGQKYYVTCGNLDYYFNM